MIRILTLCVVAATLAAQAMATPVAFPVTNGGASPPWPVAEGTYDLVSSAARATPAQRCGAKVLASLNVPQPGEPAGIGFDSLAAALMSIIPGGLQS